MQSELRALRDRVRDTSHCLFSVNGNEKFVSTVASDPENQSYILCFALYTVFENSALGNIITEVQTNY